MILNNELVNEEDLVIFISGIPFAEKLTVNWLRFEKM